MKIKILVCLLFLSVVSLGKVGLFFVKDSRVVVSSLPVESGNVMDVQEAQLQNNMLKRSRDWLLQEIIPSAEAAKAIALDEENETSSDINSLKMFKQKQALLEAREQALDERESEITDAEKRAAEKITALEALQTRIEALLQQEESIKDKKIKRLTSVYEGMKADRAAPVIAQMELSIVVKMFLRMNEKQVGKILSFLPPQQAVVISQALTQRIASVGQ